MERMTNMEPDTGNVKIRLGHMVIDPYLLAFCFAIVVFAVFQSRTIGLPFYWDEAWVYAPAVKQMHEHGASLLPGSIDPQLSRGHPLLFHFLGAIWTLAFGWSRQSLHVLALFISTCLLVATYLLAARSGSKQVALGAVMLLLVNETFLAQSGLFLPEILLTLFLVLTVYFFSTKNAVAYVLAGTAALLTKESAIVLVIALLLWQTVAWMRKRRSGNSQHQRWVIVTLIPVIFSAFYFLYQLRVHGWLVFPDHVEMMTWNWKDIIYKLKVGFSDLFEEQGWVVLTYAFAYAAPVLWRGWDRRWAFVVIFLYVASIKVLIGRWTLTLPLSLIVPVVCLGLVFCLLFLKYDRRDAQRGEVVGISYLFVLGFLGFSALNFFTNRYLVCLVPFIASGMLIFIHSALEGRPWSVFPAFVLILCGILLDRIGKDEQIGDMNLNYVDAISVNHQIVAYCESQGLYETHMFGSYMTRMYMTDVGAGYLSSDRRFTNISDTDLTNATYAIVTNESPDEGTIAHLRSSGFILDKEFTSGIVRGGIYHRPKPSF